MTIDFEKLNARTSLDVVVEPRKIFTTLKRVNRFRRPYDEQGEILDKWFSERQKPDTTIKMNTGSGKTLVGLLALQSSLNEGIGTSVYVAPDQYLVQQVMSEAKDLGIPVTENSEDSEFLASKSILVINIHKLINGKSVFGVGGAGSKIRVGTFIIDDAHACLARAKEQFNIKIPFTHPLYSKLFNMFRSSLEEQSKSGVLELESQEPQRVMAVPFWAWNSHEAEIIKLLHGSRDENELKFKWQLLSEVVGLCQCVFGADAVEIAPRYLPIEVIPSFRRARRRIYMTATLADDGILTSHFQAKVSDISEPIRPKGVGDMGDRMILIPQEINPDITDDEIKKYAAELSEAKNVVVLVPSNGRARYWSDVAKSTLVAENISSGVEQLKKGHVGLVVLVNKYDGIDLPDKACELLIIDGLPEMHGIIEKAEASMLDGTDFHMMRSMERIEQGMGRGVRSSEDHCAILLMGARLIQKMRRVSGRVHFSPATMAQLNLARDLTKQLKGKTMNELRGVLDFCLNEDANWQQTSRTALATAPEGAPAKIDPAVQKLRDAFDHALGKRWVEAAKLVQELVRTVVDPIEKGYLMQQLAEYTHHFDPSEAQKILVSARYLNTQVLSPIDGISYTRLKPSLVKQSIAISENLMKYGDENELAISVNALLEDLKWDPDETNRFENAIYELGILLGFQSQQPEKEFGVGPDNLWGLGSSYFCVIEAKSGVIGDVICKKDCNQLLGSISWFRMKYGDTSVCHPIMFHPSNKFDKQASPSIDMRIVDSKSLEKLKAAVRSFILAIASTKSMGKTDYIEEQLKHFKLSSSEFIKTYTSAYSQM